METYTVEILEPKAKKLLDDLADLRLIKMQKVEKPERKERKFDSMKGLVKHIADDFDAPLDFSENGEKKKLKKLSKAERLELYLSAPVMSDEEYESHQQVKKWMNQWKPS